MIDCESPFNDMIQFGDDLFGSVLRYGSGQKLAISGSLWSFGTTPGTYVMIVAQFRLRHENAPSDCGIVNNLRSFRALL